MSLLEAVTEKVDNGQRITDDEATELFESADLLTVGALADRLNRRKNGDTVFYNVNRHINPTNICALSCKFCAYSRKPGEEGAYAYSVDQMVEKAGEAVAQGATEVHMVGGLHPRWKFDHYKDMIRAIKEAYPDLHLKAFTAVELDWLSKKARKSVPQVLEELVEAGLGSLPGGGAEIFHPEIREQICDTKVPAEKWIDTHRRAHSLGLRSNCTMLYGHIENYAHRVDHLRWLRDLQDETQGFNAFIPLSFQPFQNEMGIDRYTFGYDDLKTIAIARLYLDNFDHVKAYWIMLGQDIAQLALQFGANDLDGTVLEEKISRMAGGRAGVAMSRSDIETLIRKAGRTPRERDTLYNPIIRDGEEETSAPTQPSLDKGSLRSGASQDPDDDLLERAKHADAASLGAAAAAKRDQSHPGVTASLYPVIELPPELHLQPEKAREYVASERERSREQWSLHPAAVNVDLSWMDQDGAPPDAGPLLETLAALGQGDQAVETSVSGLKALWKLAQAEGVNPTTILSRLKEAGVDLIASSLREAESDLTEREIVGLHQKCHELGFSTIGKVEIAAPAQRGAQPPTWEPFLRRITSFREAFAGERLFGGIFVTVSSPSFLAAGEYMRAVAVARLAADPAWEIFTPLMAMPALSPGKGLGTRYSQHAAEKFGAICLEFGSSGLGPVPLGHLDPRAVMDQIRSVGYLPTLGSLRTWRRTQGESPRTEPDPWADTRHVPALRA